MAKINGKHGNSSFLRILLFRLLPSTFFLLSSLHKSRRRVHLNNSLVLVSICLYLTNVWQHVRRPQQSVHCTECGRPQLERERQCGPVVRVLSTVPRRSCSSKHGRVSPHEHIINTDHGSPLDSLPDLSSITIPHFVPTVFCSLLLAEAGRMCFAQS